MQTDCILTGDCFERLEDIEDNSIHAVVTDPPYGLAFMGRSWDDFEPKEYQEWCEQWATEVKRVLKPGGVAIMSFSNRCFPTKAISVWTSTGDMDHIWIVGSYFHFAGGFGPPQAEDITQQTMPWQLTDPMYVVYANKK